MKGYNEGSETNGKIILSWELFEQGMPKGHIAEKLSIHRETVREWLRKIQEHPEGLLGFLEQYESAKKGERAKRKVDGLLKARIYKLREENRQCCGQKIQEYLFDEYGTHLSTPTIYTILAEKYKLRSKWKKNQIRGSVIHATTPREVIQMDTVHFGMVFAFTAVDTFAKDVSVRLYPTLTSSDGRDFLTHSFQNRFRHTELLQTDGGSEFKGEFKRNVFTFADRFRVARPYKKNEQSYIESFNRSLRKECLGWANYSSKDIPEMNKDLTEYLTYYHTSRSPPELFSPKLHHAFHKINEVNESQCEGRYRCHSYLHGNDKRCKRFWILQEDYPFHGVASQNDVTGTRRYIYRNGITY